MTNPALETVAYPFAAFNFSIELKVEGLPGHLCAAAFSECDGLEMTMEPKTLRQGGDNGAVVRLAGPVGYGQLTLKRGMTASSDLWSWFAATVDDPSLRASGLVVVLAPDGQTERVRFALTRCLPVKLKAPPLNARDGAIAIEELGLVYDRLELVPTQGGSRATAPGPSGGTGVGASAGGSAAAPVTGGLGA